MSDNAQPKWTRILAAVTGESTLAHGGWRHRLRLAAVLTPLLAALALLIWTYAVRRPMLARSQVENRALLDLQNTIDQASLTISDQEAVKLATEADAASARLVGSTDELDQLVGRLRQQAQQVNLSLAVLELPDDFRQDQAAGPVIPQELSVQLRPGTNAEGATGYGAVRQWLARLPRESKRLAITGLTITADVNGIAATDVTLRFLRAVPHEKTAE